MAYRSINIDSIVTKRLSCYSLIDLIIDDCPLINELRKIKFKFFDTWGVNCSNYKKFKLEVILEGKVTPETPMNDYPVQYFIEESNEIDTVIIFFPITIAGNNELLSVLQENIRVILEYGIYPIVIINYTTLVDKDKVNEYIKEIIKITGLTSTNIVVFDNYENEIYKDAKKDLLYRNILLKVVAETQRRRKQNHILLEKKRQATLQNIKKTSNKYCSNIKCNYFKQPVLTPFCPYCGAVPRSKGNSKLITIIGSSLILIIIVLLSTRFTEIRFTEMLKLDNFLKYLSFK